MLLGCNEGQSLTFEYFVTKLFWRFKDLVIHKWINVMTKNALKSYPPLYVFVICMLPQDIQLCTNIINYGLYRGLSCYMLHIMTLHMEQNLLWICRNSLNAFHNSNSCGQVSNIIMYMHVYCTPHYYGLLHSVMLHCSLKMFIDHWPSDLQVTATYITRWLGGIV